MDQETAQIINAACVSHVMYQQGFFQGPLPDLSEYTLEDLVQAAKMVKEANNTSDGSIHSVCAERLLAALYVSYHYDGEDSGDVKDPVCLGRNAVFVVKISKNQVKAS